MYKIKQKRTLSFLGFLLSLAALAVIGFGIGYACSRFIVNPQESEILHIVPTPSPHMTSSEESKAAFGSSAETLPKNTPSANEYCYLVRYEDGKTNVYDISNGKKVLSHTLPIKVASLRQDDLTMLRNGVFLKTKDELLSFTEDFCS